MPDLQPGDEADFPHYLDVAWRRMVKEAARSDLPDPLLLADYNYSWRDVKTQILSEMSSNNGYVPRQAEILDLPKDALTVRPIARMRPEDQVVYDALVFSIASVLDSHLNPAVYSYRWNSEKETLRSGVGDWKVMQRVGRKLHEDRPMALLAKTDVGSFYEYVDLDILKRDLDEMVSGSWAVERLMKFLHDFGSFNQVWGLPQGSDASGVLANMYLLPVDQYLQDEGLRYLRFSDDISIFGSDWNLLRQTLISVTRIMRGRHLSVSGTKTKILSGSAILAEFEDAEKDAISYGINTGYEGTHHQLVDLFEAAIAKDPPNYRDIKFALSRFPIFLEDRAVDWILENYRKYPQLAAFTSSYLSSFMFLRPEVEGRLLDFISTGHLGVDPFTEMHAVRALLRNSVTEPRGNAVMWALLLDKNKQGYVRELAARYVGRNARPGDAARLEQEFKAERNIGVKRALLVARFEALRGKAQWVADVEGVLDFPWLQPFLASNPSVVRTP